MDELLRACKAIFDKSPQATAVARLLVGEDGEPYDFAFAYLNQAMADLTSSQVEDVLGVQPYRDWGNDDMSWLAHFSDAAFRDIPCEFETAAIMLEQFCHVTVTPLVPGYCTFMIQDVTAWVDQEPYLEDDLAVALFFLDLRTTNIMLTSPAQERYGFEKKYVTAQAFAERVFGQNGARALIERVERLYHGGGDLNFEGGADDGRWLKISSGRIAQSERFVVCLIEDVTRMRDAEMRSAHRMDVIESLTRENFALYVVDVEHGALEVYNRTRDALGIGFVRFIVDESFASEREAYLREVVAADDRERVDAAISREGLRAFFASGHAEATITYRRLLDGEEKYVEARFLRLAGHEQTAVVAIRSTHAEMEEQLRQKRALQKALDLAQHASAAKSTFLTNMSHDLRTPMNSIVGFTDLALENEGDAARMADCLRKIQKSSTHLLGLINEVLDVSRIESGVIEMEEDEIDLLGFAGDMRTLFSGEAEAKGIAFDVDVSALKRTRVLADRQHLGQILVNLIGNAFKFTARGGSVRVTFAEYGDRQAGHGSHVPEGYGRFDICVADTGCGMLPEFMGKLFEPFERDGLGRPNTTEGTGLGMPITKSLVELMGGAIEVESEVGRGSAFTVTLPLRLACGEDGALPEACEVGASRAEAACKEGAAREYRFDGKRVLIADDDELSREMLREILRGAGFAVDEAEDGAQALKLALAAKPGGYDAILMDMRMPNMSGDEAARAIRDAGRDDLRALPIIALTADAFEEGRRRSREAGMVAHITKPFKTKELLARLAAVL